MKVPLTVIDHLRRAEQVYGHRTAFIDEPVQPAKSWGTQTYAEMARRARAQAAQEDVLLREVDDVDLLSSVFQRKRAGHDAGIAAEGAAYPDPLEMMKVLDATRALALSNARDREIVLVRRVLGQKGLGLVVTEATTIVGAGDR